MRRKRDEKNAMDMGIEDESLREEGTGTERSLRVKKLGPTTEKRDGLLDLRAAIVASRDNSCVISLLTFLLYFRRQIFHCPNTQNDSIKISFCSFYEFKKKFNNIRFGRWRELRLLLKYIVKKDGSL